MIHVLLQINSENDLGCQSISTFTDQFRKLHIWDPQSVKVYRKSGRVNYPQKIWD